MYLKLVGLNGISRIVECNTVEWKRHTLNSGELTNTRLANRLNREASTIACDFLNVEIITEVTDHDLCGYAEHISCLREDIEEEAKKTGSRQLLTSFDLYWIVQATVHAGGETYTLIAPMATAYLMNERGSTIDKISN